MKTNLYSQSNIKPKTKRAFTLIELLVVVVVVALLLALHFAAVASAKDQTLRGQCAAHLRNLALVTTIIATDNGDNLPSENGGVTSWAWDMSWNLGNMLSNYTSVQTFYCPASGFTADDNNQLWNFGTGSFHVIGYAPTFPGTADLNATNLNSRLTPQRIPTGINQWIPMPSAAQRVLFADATISLPGQNNPALAATYNWTNIQGGFSKAHRTPHLDGALPAGGNIAMLDGHVEWRSFSLMLARSPNTGQPVFWW